MAQMVFEDVKTETVMGGVRYVLPRRRLGAVRWLGAGLAVFGAMFFFAGLAGVVININDGKLFEAFLCGALFVPVGAAPLAGGAVLLLLGRCEITFTRDTLRCTDRVGLFRWTRRRPAGSLTAIRSKQVSFALAFIGPLAGRAGDFHDTSRWLGMIRAEFDPGKGLLLAVWYPKPLLDAMVEHMKEVARDSKIAKLPATVRQHRQPSTPTVADHAPPAPPKPPRRDTPISRPLKSLIQHEVTADGLTLRVPPLLHGQTLPVILFGVISVSGASAVGTVFGSDILYLLLPVAAVVSLALLHYSKKWVVIDVLEGHLLITQDGLFGTRLGMKQDMWRASELETIDATSYTVSSKDSKGFTSTRKHHQLEIQPKRGDAVRCLKSRDRDELAWLAYVLRQALGVRAGRA